jgi:hypothetical protein
MLLRSTTLDNISTLAPRSKLFVCWTELVVGEKEPLLVHVDYR